MIYQPKNVRPSSSALDVSQENIFSMEIQTNSCVSAYKLYLLDFDNNVVYSSLKVLLEEPIYNGEKLYMNVPGSFMGLSNGTNYKWRLRLYQPTADMIITYGNTPGLSTRKLVSTQINMNIKEGMMININSETRIISSYDYSTGTATLNESLSSIPDEGDKYYILSDFIETTPDYIIYARKTPDVYIDNVPDILTLKYHTFKGVYSQDDNVPITYYQFDLFIEDENGDLVELDSSGKIYSAKLNYVYNGFRTGSYYYIRLTVENDLGVSVTTELYRFFVDYEIIEYLQQPQAKFNEQNDSVIISWATPVEHWALFRYIKGEAPLNKFLYNVPYSTVNSLYTDGYIAEWKSDDGLYVIPEEFNITTQFSPDSDFYTDKEGRYMPIKTIIETESEDKSGKEAFKLCLDDFNLVYMTPLVQDDKVVSTTILSISHLDDDTYINIKVESSLNYSQYPYIYFSDRDYIAKIKEYKASDNTLTIRWTLPEEPSIGEKIIINNSLVQPLYLGTNEMFVLTSNGVPQTNEDYVWADDLTWDDTYIWTEGGTPLERVCNHWWKVQITNDSIRAEEIYPSV